MGSHAQALWVVKKNGTEDMSMVTQTANCDGERREGDRIIPFIYDIHTLVGTTHTNDYTEGMLHAQQSHAASAISLKQASPTTTVSSTRASRTFHHHHYYRQRQQQQQQRACAVYGTGTEIEVYPYLAVAATPSVNTRRSMVHTSTTSPVTVTMIGSPLDGACPMEDAATGSAAAAGSSSIAETTSRCTFRRG
jgi:hypothetical protein